MALQQRLQTRLSQKLILTPSLQQAIKLLPMTTLELADLLTQEVVENPMLEEVPAEDLDPPDPEAAGAANGTEPDKADAGVDKDLQDSWDDSDYEYFFGDYLDDGYRRTAPREVSDLPPIENTLSTTGTLADHLMSQLALQPGNDDPLTRDLGAAIIGNLDDRGYLRATVGEIAGMGGWDAADVERVLRVVQGFDPSGVAARGLQECLLLQIAHRGLNGTPSETIVREHLKLLQNQQGQEIARRLGLSLDEVKHHVGVIRQLDSAPGSRYNPAASQHVVPDVYVVKQEDGYVARLNEDGMPQLRISPVYRRLLDKNNGDRETRAWAKEKCRAAVWLIRSVDQRQKTIHKVATSIISFQKDFLDRGIESLRPLVLRNVAEDIGMHESTVSRVVNNKYMHTPQGVLEMRYFFHSGVSNACGENVSSVAIKQRLRRIIDREDRRKPLSDARIVKLLQDDGLMLARRTIAKYREEMKIPTSGRRRALF